MSLPYWIVDSAIIFKLVFNECLDNYVEIISKYPILIFSNYNDPHMTLKRNNVYNEVDYKLHIGSWFDRPLYNSLLKLTNLEVLIFGDSFNKPLDNSLSNQINLIPLNFGYYFNQPLNNTLSNLSNLKKLNFDKEFNQPLGNSLSNFDNLKVLTLGRNFDQSIVIPCGIKKLTLNCNSQSIIDYLPTSIEELELGYDFNLELNNLPSSIKKIIIKNPDYNKKLNNLPTGIENLFLNAVYKVPIDGEYKNTNIVKF